MFILQTINKSSTIQFLKTAFLIFFNTCLLLDCYKSFLKFIKRMYYLVIKNIILYLFQMEISKVHKKNLTALN